MPRLLIAVVLLLLAGCAGDPMPPSSPTYAIAVDWEVLQNPTQEPLQAVSRLTITNEGSSTLPVHGWRLYFNFSRLFAAGAPDTPLLVEHVNGDFYRLSPGPGFQPLEPGASVSVDLRSSDWLIKKTDAPAGFYLVADEGGDPLPIEHVRIHPFTRPEQTTRYPGDIVQVPTPASRYDANASLTLLPTAELPPVLPTPVRLTRTGGDVRIDAATRIQHGEGLAGEARYLAGALRETLGIDPATAEGTGTGPGIVTLLIEPVSAGVGVADEAYRLDATAQGIVIRGATASGVFYGIQSLRGLIPPDATGPEAVMPAVAIVDAPRFPFRGMHVDVARNFHEPDRMKRLLEAMAFYKLNRLHVHLSDDEGWRLEIAGLPELTAVGARRGHTIDEADRLYPSYASGPAPEPSAGTGYYSREAFIDLLRFALERHIEVIPEFDFPGHSRAAIRSMEARYNRLAAAGDPEAAAYRLIHPEDASSYQSVQLWNDNVIDVCLPSTYTFIQKVIDETVALYREAGAPLTAFHVGGDEVPRGAWVGSPACRDAGGAPDPEALKESFFASIYAMLEPYGLVMAGWEEMALHHGEAGKVPSEVLRGKKVRANTWNTVWGWGDEDNAYRLANAGYDVVMSNAGDLYFDLAYDKDPEEPGYYWAGFVDTYAAFAFTPLDLFKSARTDRMGHPLDPDALAAGRERLTASGRDRIRGIQGQLWSENAVSRERFEYLIFPKLLGLAERAWAPAPSWETSSPARGAVERAAAWNVFANRLGQRELPRLDRLAGGIAYRIPPPGVRVDGGLVRANTAFPGMAIHFSSDGTEPDAGAARYEGPLPAGSSFLFRVFSTQGRGSTSAAF
ncbi:MAG: family 20 glycosylhydrolase [Rhodothermales bacterium]